ncbi:hypothetical protein BST27_11115 [Mycobacterium intermedium]|uniref:Uncharacterized protein n=1 Tax=Mycobacterium intermedium TaxID=28445 RepID=A0A1E3SHK3_MYCIE|nr:hypothetical protein [Mycobacterium intermedium]MCV6964863.1 hypothetical protein [Mycobacterium intermedium]ODR01637.1 hypothetical protein BHQ20_07525 [Mycobacterium intermedium]OPE49261.1 hypothetical protein BV508_14850 [Mycobacterium intermedium]ORB06310.1 hypothetical protein BST27_11115 [Mycobacterium intermedium]
MNPPNTTVDQHQTDEFLKLLARICRRINHRVDMYYRAGVAFDGEALIERPWGFEQLARLDERDRMIVEELTGQLQRRFPAAAE